MPSPSWDVTIPVGAVAGKNIKNVTWNWIRRNNPDFWHQLAQVVRDVGKTRAGGMG
jgi:hypothetical protein